MAKIKNGTYDYYFFKLNPGETMSNKMRTDKDFVGSAMHQDKGMLKHLGNEIIILGIKYKIEGWLVNTISGIVHVFVSDK